MEPLGDRGVRDAIANLTAVLVNLYRTKGEALTLDDFRIRYGREEDQPGWVDPAERQDREVEAAVRQLLLEQGGYDARTGITYPAPDGRVGQ